jgi:IS5 family transposase
MSLCQSGVNRIIQAGNVAINIPEQHPLIQLGQALPWKELVELILPDLKKTKTGCWWLGRKLKVRTHLGVYFLQQIFNKTDRQIEYDVKDNGAYQIFCGRYIVADWHVPDHTKIEKFRSRLSSETQKRLANKITFHAVKLGFADCGKVDIDSTVQEANMMYPADSCLLKKLGVMCKKTADFLNKVNAKKTFKVDLKKISSTAREYFFLAKNAAKEIKDEKLMHLLKVVTKEVKPIIHACENVTEAFIKKMPWNQRRTIQQIRESAYQYLKDVKTFLKKGFVVPTKRLCFHLKEVVCITKGKLGKKYQFGRVFQLGRLGGNFFIVGKCTSTRMPDKTTLGSIIKEHENIFGTKKIKSVSTDKGYYSHQNEKLLAKKGVEEIGIQRPCNIKKKHVKPLSVLCQEKLANRRSGIEPLIGHIKQNGQLGRSRMKSDQTIESSGYTAVLGFNMRQLIRHQKGKNVRKTA